MKYIGLSFMILGVFFISRLFLKKREDEIFVAKELLSLGEYIEKENLSHMRTIEESFALYKPKFLSKDGTGRVFFENNGIRDFVFRLKPIVFSEPYGEIRELLLGERADRYEKEKERISASVSRLRVSVEDAEEKHGKRKITAPALSVSIAIGVAIIFL